MSKKGWGWSKQKNQILTTGELAPPPEPPTPEPAVSPPTPEREMGPDPSLHEEATLPIASPPLDMLDLLASTTELTVAIAEEDFVEQPPPQTSTTNSKVTPSILTAPRPSATASASALISAAITPPQAPNFLSATPPVSSRLAQRSMSAPPVPNPTVSGAEGEGLVHSPPVIASSDSLIPRTVSEPGPRPTAESLFLTLPKSSSLASGSSGANNQGIPSSPPGATHKVVASMFREWLSGGPVPYWLLYQGGGRGKVDKERILSAAVELGHGEITLAVIFYLQATLKPSLAMSLIARYSGAVSIFAAYLSERAMWQQLEALYAAVEDARQLLYLRWKLSFRTTSLEQRLAVLSQVHDVLNDPFHKSLLSEQLALLKAQARIATGPMVGALLMGSPAYETVLFLASLDDPEPSGFKPEGMARTLAMSDVLYQYIWVLSKARKEDWAALDTFVGSGKSRLLFGSRYKGPVSLPTLLEVSTKHGAPHALRTKIAKAIPDSKHKGLLCISLGLYSIAIPTLIAVKAKKELIELRSELVERFGRERTVEQRAAIDAAVLKMNKA